MITRLLEVTRRPTAHAQKVYMVYFWINSSELHGLFLATSYITLGYMYYELVIVRYSDINKLNHG